MPTVPPRCSIIVARATMAAIVVAWLLIVPAPVEAHATVVSSYPQPGQKLESAPGVVVLEFSEPINSRLSRAVVRSPGGERFSGTASNAHEIQVRLATNVTGVYRVDWTTVSLVDGHTLRGSFEFGVGVTPGQGSSELASTVPPVPDLLIALARAVEDGALLFALGAFALRRLADHKPCVSWARPRTVAPLALATVAGLVVVVGEALNAAPTPSPAALVDFLTTGLPAATRLGRLAAEGTALAIGVLAPDLVVVPIVFAMVCLAAAGHAAAVQPTWLGVAFDSGHLVAAGLWAGGILAVASLRPPGGWREEPARALLVRFAPLALGAFALTVAFGALRATQELSRPGDLLDTPYGLVLSVKAMLVAAMAGLSLRAWRRRLVLPRSEGALAALVILAAALLEAFPLPPARASAVDDTAGGQSADLALPRPGDLTLAGTAGDVLVGLTLRPGQPGANELLLYLLPVQGEEAAAGLRVTVSVNGRPVSLSSCGSPCREAAVDLAGGERIDVSVGGERSGSSTFQLPSLPAADGAELLRRTQQRMHALHSYRIDETLGPASPPVQTRYSFQSPDRLGMTTASGFQSVWVGKMRYSRAGPDQPWQREDFGSAPQVPEFAWDLPPGQAYVAPRILGSQTIDGVRTEELSFFAEIGGLPTWFRLLVDRTGLVHHAEMLTQGHFMEHRIYDVDAPFVIAPPAG